MTVRARNRVLVAGIVIGVAALAATLLPMLASTAAGPPREIRLVIRDMAFYVDGQMEPNPTLSFHAGERVRLRVRSEDAGMNHDFAITEWQVRSDTVEGRGETAITMDVPRRATTAVYHCTPHAGRMRGTIRVE